MGYLWVDTFGSHWAWPSWSEQGANKAKVVVLIPVWGHSLKSWTLRPLWVPSSWEYSVISAPSEGAAVAAACRAALLQV